MPDKKPKKETNQGLPLTSTQANNMMITNMGYNATTNPSATWYYPTAKPPSAKPSFGTNMRDFAIGSQERADEYTKRGWAQDATTKVSQQNKPAVTSPASSASSTATDFKKIGAISTALGGNTDYDAGLGFETQNPFRIAAKTAKATPATETVKATPATQTAVKGYDPNFDYGFEELQLFLKKKRVKKKEPNV
jgi:hypothetical protein